MNASCVSCGYRFGGVAIESNMITSPECGEENRFEFEPINRSKFIWLGAIRITLLALAGVAILATLLWMTGAAALLRRALGS